MKISNEELERRILNQVHNFLPSVSTEGIIFEKGKDGSPEAIYVFHEDGLYHVVEWEKGSPKLVIKTKDERDVLYCVLDIIITREAMQFSYKNHVKGRDSRRLMFSKQLELFSQCDSDLFERGKKEINKILSEYPYRDSE